MTLLTNFFYTSAKFAFFLQEGEHGAVSFTLWDMIRRMDALGLTIFIIMLLMSMYSIAIAIERFLTYNAAKNQSRLFAPKVAAALKGNRIDEAISISDKHKKSHLAMVVNAGLQEFQNHNLGDLPGEEIEASRRALQRATAIKAAEFKRGLSALATIGSTAPFVGLFGTVIGIVKAFQGMNTAEGASIQAVAPGISEALINTAVGLIVAVPAVWMFNYFTSRVESFLIEMDNSSSELIDYFLKQRGVRK